MNPRIVELEPKTLVGMNLSLSLANNKTQELFSRFMPLRNSIQHAIGTDIYEVMIYDQLHFKDFNPARTFVKWAAYDVSNSKNLPAGMNMMELEGGHYAVFIYKGLAKDFGLFMKRIFMEWLPSSLYELDHRAHFNVLGERYKHNDLESEEEVWIPIKKKQ